MIHQSYIFPFLLLYFFPFTYSVFHFITNAPPIISSHTSLASFPHYSAVLYCLSSPPIRLRLFFFSHPLFSLLSSSNSELPIYKFIVIIVSHTFHFPFLLFYFFVSPRHLPSCFSFSPSPSLYLLYLSSRLSPISSLVPFLYPQKRSLPHEKTREKAAWPTRLMLLAR